MKKILLLVAICMMAIVGCKAADSKPATEKPATGTEKVELVVYAGAGLKKPMEVLKSSFEKDNNVTLNMIYAGSGQLLAQLEKSGKGDVFVVGSKATYDDAMKKGLTNDPVPVAHHTPIIITAKGNPKGIKGLSDLARDGVKVALGEPASNAIGKTAEAMFKKNVIEGVEKNIVVKTGTVNELYTAIASGNADCAIVTKDGAFQQKDKFDLVEIPDSQNIDQIINAGSIKASKNMELSNKFVEYLKSETGKKAFEEFGFKAVK